MKNSLLTKRLTVLAKFASKDVTRPDLCSMYHDEKSRSLVSTDGHRLCFFAELYDEKMKNRAYSSVIYLKTKELVDSTVFRYPSSLIAAYLKPADAYYSPLKLDPMPFLGKIDTLKKPLALYITLKGQISITRPKEFLTVLDARLLAPLAAIEDLELSIPKVNTSASPVLIISKELGMRAVIMPMRA